MEVEFKSTEEFRNPDNTALNRFLNVPCYDHSRVPIESRLDKNTYIHANFVPGFHSEKDYILTQAPLPETIKDFWSMIFDHDIDTIVMVSLTIPIIIYHSSQILIIQSFYCVSHILIYSLPWLVEYCVTLYQNLHHKMIAKFQRNEIPCGAGTV